MYFASYPSLKRDRVQWWAVFNTKARSDIDAPLDIDFYQEEIIEDRPTLCALEDVPNYDTQGDDDDDLEPQNLHTDEIGDGGESDDIDDDDNDNQDDDFEDEEEDEDFDEFDDI